VRKSPRKGHIGSFARNTAGQGAGRISGQDFHTRRVEGGDSARMMRREIEADVRGQTAAVEFVAPPTDDRFSFAIRSASCGNLLRE
jgi:hypothetical protein